MKRLIFRIFVGIVTCFTCQLVVGDELDAELYELQRAVIGRGASFGEVANEYLELSKDFDKPEQLGRIFASRFLVYTSIRGSSPDDALEFAQAAMAHPLEPLEEMKVCLRAGSLVNKLHELADSGTISQSRRESAVYYFRGLSLAVKMDLHGLRKESDAPMATAIFGAGPEYERMKVENDKRLVARTARDYLGKVENLRGQLERKLLLLYSEKPHDTEEARELALRYLEDQDLVDGFMKKLQATIGEREKSPLNGAPIFYAP